MIEITGDSKILYDTDFLISLFVADQSTHQDAKEIFKKVENNSEAFIVNLVVFELATVLSYKFSAKLSHRVIYALNELPWYRLEVDEETEREVWKEFFGHSTNSTKGVSFVDCANVVFARKYNLLIASFDTFYPKDRCLLL